MLRNLPESRRAPSPPFRRESELFVVVAHFRQRGADQRDEIGVMTGLDGDGAHCSVGLSASLFSGAGETVSAGRSLFQMSCAISQLPSG